MRSARVWLAVAVLGIASTAVLADDLTGNQKFLCTASQTTVCWSDGDCETGPPWNWDVPQFIEVDLAQKRLSTTKASGQNRATTIAHLRREDGELVLQGYENGRAFSIVIDEKSGYMTAAVAVHDLAATVFGACTPKLESE